MTTDRNRFKEALKELNHRLDLPQPAKSHVLLEISGDLQELEAHYLERGAPRDEAQQKALEMCDLSDEALAQLVGVHGGAYRRFLDHFSAQAQTWWERLLLALVFLVMAWTAGGWMVTSKFLTMVNLSAWPILALTLLAVVLICPKYYAAFMKKEHHGRRLRAGLSIIPCIAGINLLIGLSGSWLGLYPIARKAMTDDEEIQVYMAQWLMSGSATLVFCFVSVLVISLLWFILINKVSRIEEAEASALLAEPG